MFKTIYRFKDIMDAPACTRIGGEKCISVEQNGLHAWATMMDGDAHYFRKDKNSMWEMVGFKYCQTY